MEEEQKMQEIQELDTDASLEEMGEESVYLSLEDILAKTKAKAEANSYPWRCVLKMGKAEIVGGAKKTHICLECLNVMFAKKTRRTPNDWHAACCNARNASNAWLHLQRIHSDSKNPSLVKELEKKQAKKRKGFSTAMKTTMEEEIAIETTTRGSNGEIIVKKQKSRYNQQGKLQFVTNDQVLNSLSTFLIRSGVAFNAIDNEEFKTFYRLARSDNKARTLGRSVHNENIDAYHDEFKGLIVKALKREMESMHGFPFLNLIHDMWTNKAVKSVLGVSLSYIDCNWRKVYLALFVGAHKEGHAARIVSSTIKKRMADEYPELPFTDYVWTVVSDTTSSARNVARDFEDSTQIDCSMHSANLGLKYGLGISENYTTDRSSRVRTLVTPGADGEAFTEANNAISKLRALVKYFGTPERRSKLQECADESSYLKYTIPGIDGDTRAAGIPTLIQKVVFNYCLLKEFFTEKCVQSEQEVFTCITEDEWILLIELEAIVEPLAKFTRSTVQSGSLVTASYFLYWKKQFMNHVDSNESFKVLTRAERGIGETYMTQKRTTKTKTDFSNSSAKCFKRLKHQLLLRFQRPQRDMELNDRDEMDLYFAMCLDPRTKSLANKQDYALNRPAFKAKHYEFYKKMIYGVRGVRQEPESVDSNSDVSDLSSGVIHDEDFDESLVVDTKTNDVVSRAESHKIVDDWMKMKIDFDAVVQNQYCKKNKEFDRTLLYKSARGRDGSAVRIYSIDALYHYMDVLEWWKENDVKFPTLALMARVYLSRELSSCFQERVFSIAGFTGNKLRTTTIDDRAEKLALGSVNKEEHVYLRNSKR